MTDEERRRLGFAAQLVIAVSRGLTGVNPCGALYTVDNPDGFNRPVKFCGCNYPAWEVTQLRGRV